MSRIRQDFSQNPFLCPFFGTAADKKSAFCHAGCRFNESLTKTHDKSLFFCYNICDMRGDLLFSRICVILTYELTNLRIDPVLSMRMRKKGDTL